MPLALSQVLKLGALLGAALKTWLSTWCSRRILQGYSKMLRDARLRRRQGQDDEEDLEPDDFDDGSDVVVHYEP